LGFFPQKFLAIPKNPNEIIKDFGKQAGKVFCKQDALFSAGEKNDGQKQWYTDRDKPKSDGIFVVNDDVLLPKAVND